MGKVKLGTFLEAVICGREERDRHRRKISQQKFLFLNFIMKNFKIHKRII